MSLMPRSQRTLLGAKKTKKVHALENMSALLDVQSKGHNSSEEVVSDGRSEQQDAIMMPAKDVVEGGVELVSSALDDDDHDDSAAHTQEEEEEEEDSVVNEKFANVPFNNLSCEFGIREFRPGKPWSAIRELHRTLDPQRDVVERSACQTAAGRALWNHVIHDPLAEVLAGDSFLSSLQEKMKKDWQSNAREVPGVMLAVRTLWFDSRLSQALNRFPPYCTPQVVLLGAGMDARAYRMSSLKECSVFEVDFLKVVQLKESLLQALVDGGQMLPELHAKSIQRVAADVASQDWFLRLVNAGFNQDWPTVWMLEGFLYYLHEFDAKETLKCISLNCKNETILLADFMNESSTHMARELDTHFYFHSDWPEELLPHLGFSNVKVSQIGDVDANFGLLEDELNLFNQIRQVPRHIKADIHGKPYRRLLLVETRAP
ncbi:hypothetical protein BDL97_09G062200 [Sphagnum fallax]|jgi:methyltransferase (TIGR00027 family)|nr:hypothetical protein BDL97_09G062200 [Sphagnum fallax]